MNTSCTFAAFSVVCALFGNGTATAATVTLGDGSYDVAFSISENGSDFAGTASASAGLGGSAFGTLSDSSVPFPRYIDFEAVLNADLSLRLFIGALGASGFSYPLLGTFQLTGLDLLVDGSPAGISGVTFNAARTNIGQYAGAGEFVSPAISFTGTSATITFGFDGNGLAGDQPDIWFDVATSTVPVPAALWLFGSGLLGLAGRTRIRKTA